MLTLTLTLALAAPLLALPPQDPELEGPPPERVKSAVAALEEAFDQDEIGPRISAIQGASDVPAKEVVAALAKLGLRSKQREVKAAAVGALGLMREPSALEELHSLAKRDKRKLRKDYELYATLLQSIARHGDASSIPILTKDFFGVRDRAVIRARILGLGNIRDVAAIEELFSLMKSADRKYVQPYMNDFNLSLVVLIGVEQGRSQDLWLKWWNDHKKTLTVLEKPPKLPQALARRWDGYWGNPRTYDRQKRRGDRGDDTDDDDPSAGH